MSGAELAGVDVVVGRARRRAAARPGARAAGRRSARTRPRACAASSRRAACRPSPRRAAARSSRRSSPRPPSPAQRARSTIGSAPPCLRSSRPRCSPLCSTTSPRRKPVGGRCDSANRASRRSSAGLARREPERVGDRRAGVHAPHRPAVDAAPRPGPAPSPGSGRRSSCAPRAARSPPSGRTPDWTRVAPCASGLQAAAPQAAHDRRRPSACRRGRIAASSGRAEPHDRACRCRSRAAPRAAPGCPAPATRTTRRRRRPGSPTASSSSRRVSVSTHDRVDRHHVGRRHPGVVQRDHHRTQLTGGARPAPRPSARAAIRWRR